MTDPRKPHDIPVCPTCGHTAYCGMLGTSCYCCTVDVLSSAAMAQITHDRQARFAREGITR